jgi:hypothetical protein
MKSKISLSLILLLLICSSFHFTENANKDVVLKSVIHRLPNYDFIYLITVFSDKTYTIKYGEGVKGSEYFHGEIVQKSRLLTTKEYNKLKKLRDEIANANGFEKESAIGDSFDIDFYINQKRYSFNETQLKNTTYHLLFEELKRLSPLKLK